MDAKVIRGVMVVCVLRAAASPLLAAAAPQVKTTSGMVEGKDEGAVHAFLGPKYDCRMATAYYNLRKSDLFRPRPVRGLLTGGLSPTPP